MEKTLDGPYRTLSRELSLVGVLASSLAVVLHRLDGREGLTFGVPLHHRSGPVARRVIGTLMELYPLRVQMSGDESFGELFGRVQRSLMDMMRHARPGESPDLKFDAVLNVTTARFGDFAGMPTATEWKRSGHVDPTHVPKSGIAAHELVKWCVHERIHEHAFSIAAKFVRQHLAHFDTTIKHGGTGT